MQDRDKLRELLFNDPKSFAAELVIRNTPDEQQMMSAYQSMTVLARLMWEKPYNLKLAQRLRRVSCPVLLLWGANDRLMPPAYGEEYRKYLPQAEWQLIPECGHLPMFERELEFVEAVARFCRA
jgi:pimeloyl-ACP methyl ester carboxylesterase